MQGRIDQVGMRLEIDRQYVTYLATLGALGLIFCRRQTLEKRRYAALEKWTEAIEGVYSAVAQKAAASNRGGEASIGPDIFGSVPAFA